MSAPQRFGLLNIDKPAGMTSRKVVDHVARLVRPAKAGHAGTLDPLATGVLVVCVGPATRLISFIQQQPKGYRAGFLLGRTSNTDDVEGEIVETPGAEAVTREQVEQALPHFVGRIEQVPPQFSAVHVGGKRAYQLARKGADFELPAKVVEVHRLTLKTFDYPELDLEIECGSGTYIRSIGRDLGRLLGCGAVMSRLERTRVGPFSVETAVQLDDLTPGRIDAELLPASLAVDPLPRHTCDVQAMQALKNGRPVAAPAELELSDGCRVAFLSPEGQLAGIGEFQAEGRLILPRQVFATGK